MLTVSSSFRDPAGSLFWQSEKLYRTITNKYINTYDTVKQSGLFDVLRSENQIVEFQERSAKDFPFHTKNVPLILEPEILPFISYPYEWSFSQLKDAALLTLDLQIAALKKKFILKDASAYNIQFLNGKPIFIDHLSFDCAEKYSAWPAYGQYCRHFLAPLLFISKVDPGLNSLWKQYLDGIPLPFARKLISKRKILNFGLFLHFWCHARSQNKYAHKGEALKNLKRLSPAKMINIALSLKETTQSLSYKPKGTQWSEYYSDTNYTDKAMQNKIKTVIEFVKEVPIRKFLWDFGGNNGAISRSVQKYADHIICFDIDFAAVEINYLKVKENNESNILPLVMDMSNPSPGLGFALQERLPINDRGNADIGMALAIVHHLSISNNIPLNYLAKYFSTLCKYLIIEFIPKEDTQVKRLLLTREDVYFDYHQDYFIEEFSKFFHIIHQQGIEDSVRTLFLMKKI